MDCSFILNNTQTESGTPGCGPLPSWAIAFLVICAIGTVANSLIIIVIALSKRKASIFMTLLKLLAVVDNVYLWIMVLIQEGIYRCIFLPDSLILSQLMTFLTFGVGTISSWLIVLISLERFIAVYYPLKVKIYCTMKRLYVSILILCIVSFLVSIAFFFTCSVKIINGTPTCAVKEHDTLQDVIILLISGCLYSFFPFCIVTAVNISIIKKMKSQRAFVMTLQRQDIKQPAFKHNTSLVTMSIAVCIVFAVSTFPGSILLMGTYLCRFLQGEFCISLDGWLFRVAVLFDEINFFLYCISGSVFRDAFCQIFRCKIRKNTNKNVQSCSTVF